MKKRRKSILLLAAMGVFIMIGCGAKEEVQESPSETFVDEVLPSVEEQTTATNETQSITPDEVQPETQIPSEEPAKVESASETKPGSEQKSQTTQMNPPKQESQTTQISPAQEVKYVNIAHIFKPYEQAEEISLQMPEDWKYTIQDVEEEFPQWGYSIQALGKDDTTFYIFGQFGTLTAIGYSNGPESFQTSQGLTGQYFWDEYMPDDKNPAIQGMIVFDTELPGFYGVIFNMPKSFYSESKDIIDKVFQSIVIKEVQ